MSKRALWIIIAAVAVCRGIVPCNAAAMYRNGLLTVDGRPFFPLGTWSDGATTPEELTLLGMNIDFRGIGPSADGPGRLRAHLAEYYRSGLHVVPYFGYGGGTVTPWAKADLERYLELGAEPGMLAWYIGDDLVQVHLPGMQATANVVRARDPQHPVVADYIATPDPKTRQQLRPFLDIMCQYGYPLPDETLRQYAEFFDKQRTAYGDPLWTWIQAFMWGHTGRELRLGGEGPGPVPEPEQVRLLTYVAVSRGVRGLLFFAIQHFRTIPEVKAEVALLCHEIGLVAPYLAAGEPSFGIKTSAPGVEATALADHTTTVVCLVNYGENYHRWVDDGISENVAFTIPAPQGGAAKALLLTFPQPVQCPVSASGDKQVRVTVPRLELAGLVVVTSDDSVLETVRSEAARMLTQTVSLAVAGATAQVRKVAAAYWLLGSDSPGGGRDLDAAQRLALQATGALRAGEDAKAFAAAREAMRLCRSAIDRTMKFAEQRRELIPESQRIFLKSFYSLPQIPGLGASVTGGEYRFVKDWMVIGPFPLEMDLKAPDEVRSNTLPPGFERQYPPEGGIDLARACEGAAGLVRWQQVQADMSGRVDLLARVSPSENMVAYGAAVVTAPKEMQAEIGFGSNDGARIWLNGELIYSKHEGRPEVPNQDKIPVKLHAGKNTILVKVENWGRNWAYYLSFRDPDGQLKFSAE